MKKIVLYLLIATFCISALMGIGIIILDLWNELTSKVLLTTVTIFGFSIPALCCSTLYEKDDYNTFSIVGMFVCIVSGIYCLLYVWDVLDYNMFASGFTFNSVLTGILASISLGHLSMMLLINNNDENVKIVKMMTIVVSVALLIALLLLIWVEDFSDVLAWQFYVIDAILVVLGTIVTPILSRARKVEIKDNSVKENNDIIILNHFLEKEYVTKEEYEKIQQRIMNKNS